MQYKTCSDCGALHPASQRRHRSRICDGYAPTWAADTRQRFFRNDEEYARQVRARVPGMRPSYLEVVVTAPGVDAGLVWDPGRCAIRGPHRHGGDVGCRVLQEAADLWNAQSLKDWPKLHEAAQEATRRAVGARAFVCFKIPEVHKRGVRHWHLLLGYTTPLEKAAADRYREELDRRSPRYGFGFVLPPVVREAGSGAGAAYFAGYFIDGKGHKASITEAVKSPVLDRCTIYVSPRLTTRSGVTMRALRLKRYLWWRIGSSGLRMGSLLGLGITEIYELHERGFWGRTLLNMLAAGEVSIE